MPDFATLAKGVAGVHAELNEAAQLVERGLRPSPRTVNRLARRLADLEAMACDLGKTQWQRSLAWSRETLLRTYPGSGDP
jgi:hypothetical protein